MRRLFFALFALMVLGNVPAQAGVLPVSVTVTPDGANYRYTYGVVLTSDSVLNAGDFFTVYDFAGMIDGSMTAPSGFSLSISADSATPNLLMPVDNPSLPNLTWTFGGPQPLVGPVNLGEFSALSMFPANTDGYFTARTHREIDGHIDSNITDTRVPVPVPPVPEPSTLVLVAALGLSLTGLRFLRR